MFVIRMIGKGELSFNTLLRDPPVHGGGVHLYETREAADADAARFNQSLSLSVSCHVEEQA